VKTMNNFKIPFFLLALFFVFRASAQLELDGDSEHAISYEVRNDSVLIYVDVFNDLSIDLDSDDNLDSGDDYVYLMFDFNSNGAIDLGGNQIDLFYTYDSTQSQGICNGHILSPSSINDCEGSTGGSASVELKATTNNTTPHVFYTFSIPKGELDFGNTGSLCGRISIKVHTGGTPLADEVSFPAQTVVEDYFVNPYNPIQLYPEAEIILPTGQVAPDQTPVAVCVGDTLKVDQVYPHYHWNGLSQEYFQLVRNDLADQYYFKISDENCIYTDTVNVQLLDEKLCEGAYVFPNIVVPNSDGINDVFQLMIGQELLNQDWKGSKLRIFNRWGLNVFGSKVDDSYPIWHLRLENGRLVSPGTYYYTYITPGDNPRRIHGFFTVLHGE